LPAVAVRRIHPELYMEVPEYNYSQFASGVGRFF
jgi:hypothetical protein